MVTLVHTSSGRGRHALTTPLAIVLLALISYPSGATGRDSWNNHMMKAYGRALGDLYAEPSIIEDLIRETKTSDHYAELFQDRFTAPFPCDVGEGSPGTSPHRPNNVNKLRPGDIDVIAAMGDSMTSGYKMTGLSVAYAVENRGYAFTTGGLGNWKNVTTIANLLKEFNPELVGTSTGSGDYESKSAGLNVAVRGAVDEDMMAQARYLKLKMLDHPNIDFEHDWKLLFISTGHNDLCVHQCKYSLSDAANAHKKRLEKVIEYIYEEIPRVFVALISVIDPSLSSRLTKTQSCKFFTKAACPCLFKSHDLEQDEVDMTLASKAFQEVEKELTKKEIYHDKNDFTLEWMPFSIGFNGPTEKGKPENPWVDFIINGETLSTPDCFHLNQRGSGLVARLLWNNLLQPVGHKTIQFDPEECEPLRCPTKKHPYIFTTKNSSAKKDHHDDET